MKPVIKVFLKKTGMKKSLKEKAFLVNALIGLSPCTRVIVDNAKSF
jgi:hypothetical protein